MFPKPTIPSTTFTSEFALASALGACCHCQSVPPWWWIYDANKSGCSLHGLAVKAGLDGNPYVGSSLMLVYAKHQRVAAVERVFAARHTFRFQRYAMSPVAAGMMRWGQRF
jgi:hypothetical protein